MPSATCAARMCVLVAMSVACDQAARYTSSDGRPRLLVAGFYAGLNSCQNVAADMVQQNSNSLLPTKTYRGLNPKLGIRP